MLKKPPPKRKVTSFSGSQPSGRMLLDTEIFTSTSSHIVSDLPSPFPQPGRDSTTLKSDAVPTKMCDARHIFVPIGALGGGVVANEGAIAQASMNAERFFM